LGSDGNLEEAPEKKAVVLRGVRFLKSKTGFQVQNKYSFVHMGKVTTRKLIAFFTGCLFYWHFDTQFSRFIE